MKVVVAGVLLAWQAVAGAQDAVRVGEAEFKRSCASCHSADAALTPLAGPGLHGVVGRKLGTAPRFNYSDAMAAGGEAGVVWTREMLAAFIADPGAVVPDTAMPSPALSEAQRSAVVAYLASLSGAAAPAVAAKVTAGASAAGAASAAASKAAAAAAPNASTTSAAAPKAAAAPAAGAASAAAPAASASAATPARTGSWSEDAPGKVHKFTVADLPQPFSSASAGNGPKLATRPDTALPKVPGKFSVSAYARLPARGRLLVRAPNGDLFLSIPATGEIRQVRPDGTTTVFATGLTRPYGMAFYPSGPNPRYLYVANVNSVVRIPYSKGDTKARAAETVVGKLAGTSGGHTTRSLQFSKDGQTMFVSVGSASNVAEEIPRKPDVPLAQWERQHGLGAAWGDEEDRALVLAFDPDGKHKRTFATGLRNCVGLLVHPDTGDLFCGVNERDALGDNLPFEYLTTVRQGAFYGWPWYYIGGHEDPRLAGVRPDLKDKVTVPDLLIQAHSAPLGLAVYHAPQGAKHAFPKDYEGDIFLALHGSWNRALRTGYKVVRVRMQDGKPVGQYEDFMTGMVLNDNEVWGRPAGVTVAADGALLVVDDGSNTIWRIAPK